MSRAVAFLTFRPPLPARSGGALRDLHLIRELAAHGWRVSLFALAPHAEPDAAERAELDAMCEDVTIEPFRVGSVRRAARVARAALSGTSFQRDHYWLSEAAARLRDRLLSNRPDAVVACTPYMARYVPDSLMARTVFDTHNAEGIRFTRMGQAPGVRLRGLVARAQHVAIERYEREILQQVARAFAVSEEDRALLERTAPGRVDLVPNGASEPAPPRAFPPHEPNILFIGAMEYAANADAADRLLREIVPRMRRRDAVATFVGANPPRRLVRAAARSRIVVEVAGSIPDVNECFRRARVLVAPLSFGGGTRLKVLEALAAGLPVVSTSVGIEGLGLRPGEDVVVADDPDAFAEAIDHLLTDDEAWARISAVGRRAAGRFRWAEIGERAHEALTRVADSDVIREGAR